MICACTERSSAEVGSSSRMNSVQRDGPGDRDALALAAGEFVREAQRMFDGIAGADEQRPRRASACPFGFHRCLLTIRPSSMIWPTDIRG